MTASTTKGNLLTIGHSNIPFEQFVANLKANDVELIMDVRSFPRSRFAPHFSAPVIEQSLRDEGISYEFMGEELGGRPESDAFYDNEGRVLYDRLADSDLFFRGLMQLRIAIARHRLAVMCSEEDPAKCHRYLLIARVLADLGYDVGHIRKDGRAERQADVMQAIEKANKRSAQLPLPNLGEQWRSVKPIRSDSLSTRRRISSKC